MGCDVFFWCVLSGGREILKSFPLASKSCNGVDILASKSCNRVDIYAVNVFFSEFFQSAAWLNYNESKNEHQGSKNRHADFSASAAFRGGAQLRVCAHVCVVWQNQENICERERPRVSFPFLFLIFHAHCH